MPPNNRFNSGEWLSVQQEIQAAVQAALGNALTAQREGIRSDLREFRDEIKGEVSGLRHDVGELKVGMAQGDGMFKLINQRVLWLENENERKDHAEQERARLAHQGDTSRINRALEAAQGKARREDGDRNSDRNKLLINPKVINAVILAFATACGASLWAILEHALAPTTPPPTVSAPTAVAPSHNGSGGGASGGASGGGTTGP